MEYNESMNRGFFSITIIAIIVGAVAIGLVGFLLITKITSDIPDEIPELIEENEIL